jgi:predicted nucleic acid-binding protein
VSESETVLDSWAWWEILRGTPTGVRLSRKYVDHKVAHSSAISLGELVAKLASLGHEKDAELAARAIRARSEVHPVSSEPAEEGGMLRARLRRVDAHASLADGIVLALARQLGIHLVSADPVFRGLSDVDGR